MSIENNLPGVESNQDLKPEKEKESTQTLENFLKQLQDDDIETLSPEQIKEQLNTVGTAIITRDYGCGIRISKIYERDGYKYKTWTTNDLENLEHPLAKKFGLKKIDIE